MLRARLAELTGTELINGKLASRCIHQIDNAGLAGSTKVNFVFTHFYVDANKDFVPEHYCFKPGTAEECVRFTAADIAVWTQAFIPCLQYAVGQGFDIAFTPHLDDGLGSGQWRNAMLIDPLRKYGGFSYTDIMLKPLADAMAAVLAPQTRVWFAMQGEMGLMVFKYPDEHRRLLPYLKSLVLGRNAAWANNVRIGVSTNYNKLCGMSECEAARVNNPVLFNKLAVQALYNAVDFIGISGYPRFQGQISDMEDASQAFDRELSLFGVNLLQLVNRGGKEFIFNEFGTGGGVSPTGDTPARTAQQAANMPYFGVYGAYTRNLDPWRSYLPENILCGTRDYLEDWYAAAAIWLSRKGGPTWRVDHVFLWNLNSWDVLGVHMQSTTKEGTYRNKAVAATVRRHNLNCRGMGGMDNPGSLPPY
eukprot:gene4880-5125_t